MNCVLNKTSPTVFVLNVLLLSLLNLYEYFTKSVSSMWPLSCILQFSNLYLSHFLHTGSHKLQLQWGDQPIDDSGQEIVQSSKEWLNVLEVSGSMLVVVGHISHDGIVLLYDMHQRWIGDSFFRGLKEMGIFCNTKFVLCITLPLTAL